MLDLLFPPACLGCGALGAQPLCAVCADGAHGWFEPPAGVRAAWCAAGFHTGVGQAMKRAKYGRDRTAVRQLAQWMATRARPALSARGYDVIVAVPSPWTRRMHRGFNPAWMFGRALSQVLDCPCVSALERRPGGVRQARLDARQRSANVLDRLRQVRPVQGRVLLVDDVVTTGSTVAACASLLENAAVIDVAALCRADVRELGSQIWDDVQVLKQASDV